MPDLKSYLDEYEQATDEDTKKTIIDKITWMLLAEDKNADDGAILEQKNKALFDLVLLNIKRTYESFDNAVLDLSHVIGHRLEKMRGKAESSPFLLNTVHTLQDQKRAADEVHKAYQDYLAKTLNPAKTVRDFGTSREIQYFRGGLQAIAECLDKKAAESTQTNLEIIASYKAPKKSPSNFVMQFLKEIKEMFHKAILELMTILLQILNETWKKGLKTSVPALKHLRR